MAKHLKINSDETVKAYSFKVKRFNDNLNREKLIEVINEYHKYYNSCSDWIKDNLNLKIGDLYYFIPEKKRNSEYAKILISDEWKDKALYTMFRKSFGGTNRDNVIYEVINAVNPEKYNGNILGICGSNYRRNGYVQSVVSNYTASLSKIKTGIKWKALSETPSHDDLVLQTIYEIDNNHDLEKFSKWNEYIKSLESSDNKNEKKIKRIKTLYKFYKEYKGEVISRRESLSVERLVGFGGCHRDDSKKSMCITGSSTTYFKIKKSTGKSLNINFANVINIDVFGHRKVMDKNGELIFNISDCHGKMFVISVEPDSIYFNISSKVPFKKKISTTEKVVGIDVNIKHMLLATSIVDDGNIKGYVNIYKEVVNDENFRMVSSKNLIETFKDISEFVTFSPDETELLFSRILKQRGIQDKMSDVEEAFCNVLYKLKRKFIDEGDNAKRIYIENVLKMRSQIKAYAVLKNVYYEKQSEYEAGKDDDFKTEHPFIKTNVGDEINSKLKRISKTIIGCRNNIIQYAYKVICDNGYTMIGLEKLNSSQFEKRHTFPSIKKLLEHYKILGCTKEEMMEKEAYNKYIKNGNYNVYFKDGRVVDAEISPDGKNAKIKEDFYNLMIKAVHFAGVKDYFITLSNNGSVGVALVPPFFTSQMDSIEHKIYCTKGSKSKEFNLVDKNKVRISQEKHINGLNADFNAARNIENIVSDENWRNMFLYETKTTESMYNKPIYDTNIKLKETIVKKLKEAGFVKLIQE